MNSKTLLLLGIVGAVAASSATAQVYSVNAVGYVNKTIPSGFSIVSNPLNSGANKLSEVIASAPIGTTIYKWTGTAFDPSVYFGTWSSDFTVAPGEGFFVNNVSGAEFVVTFVGEVPTGNLQNTLPAGFSVKSSIVPQSGLVSTDLGLPVSVGDTVYKFNSVQNAYESFPFLGVWVSGEPTVAVAEGFFFNAQAAGSWNRSFSVN